MRIIRLYALVALLLPCLNSVSAKQYQVESPSGKITANIDCGYEMTYSVSYDGKEILSESPISISLSDGTVWGKNAKVSKAMRESVENIVENPFGQSSHIIDSYNGLTLRMKGGWSVEFRAYDDGLAYRFASIQTKPFEIVAERADFNFSADYTATVPYVRTGSDDDMQSQFFNSFENRYTVEKLSRLNPRRLAFLPLAVDADGVTVAITETDLNNYPGLYLYNPDGTSSLKGKHAPYPTKTVDGGYNNIQSVVTETADYIARVEGPRTFPWRILIMGADKDIAASNLSELLAEPSRIADISWIKPGKVAWDWWNDYNIIGVDFEAGHNTPTYKHYIDFAADNGIEYVILDDGWAAGKGEDLFVLNPEIDLEEIIGYAGKKNVGIILWAGYRAFERELEKVCRHYSEMGVKGFKVDFEDRDDQLMTAFNHRAAETAAKYHLVLDLHGAYKPAGINRTWPNVLNVEGVNGLENMKWSELDSFDIIQYDTELPFLRQVAGPVDYTQGAMVNAARHNFRPVNNQPMAPGTRSHQLALYMILYSPLNMLCDSPSNYRKEQECTDFISSIPTVWDETIVLDGKMGEYIVTARRKGNDWYIGGITNWTPRDLTVDLSSLNLKDGAKMKLFTDGVNAHRNGNDYRSETTDVAPSDTLKVHLAPGGGFAAHIYGASTLTEKNNHKS
ncbi:MAG: glycoside hydrolase family 97 protein [Muribaculaceae bacterium]